jgi:hypothetical protein
MLSVRAEDVLVAVEPVRGLSARNVLEARVVSLESISRDVLVACEVAAGGPPWRARLTPAAVQSPARVARVGWPQAPVGGTRAAVSVRRCFLVRSHGVRRSCRIAACLGCHRTSAAQAGLHRGMSAASR